MAKKETVHDIVFRVYGLINADKDKKDKIRKYINRQLKKESPCNWDEFDSIQKDTFIYITICKTMLERYVIDEGKKKKIEQSINSYLKETLLNSQKPLEAYNSTMYAIRENNFDSADCESVMKQKYNHLCKTIDKYNPMVPKPTFEEWKIFPRRPLDYIESFQHDPMQYSDTNDYPSQAEIDHVIIQLLLKIVQEKANIEIDVLLIKKTLTFLKNFQLNDYDSLQSKYDPNIKIPKDKQEQLIHYNQQYILYKEMLDNLDFIK